MNKKSLSEKFAKEGKIPIAEVKSWLKRNKGIPLRTFQWYISEGFIPPPKFEGREGFYSIVIYDFILLPLINAIMSFKQSNYLKFSQLRETLRINNFSWNARDKSNDKFDPIIEILVLLSKKYPIYEIDKQGEIYYLENNDLIWSQTIKKMCHKLKVTGIQKILAGLKKR